MAKDFKFQYSLKYAILNSTEDYSLETILAKKSNFNIKICNNLGLWFSKLKLAQDIFGYFRIYRKTIPPANKFVIQARGSKQLNISQKHKNMAQNLFPNECKGIIQFGCQGKNKNLVSRKQSLRVTQNIYSPNQFYLTFRHDNF